MEIRPMIATLKKQSKKSVVTPEWHDVFLRMAPAIETHAKLVFRGLSSEAKAEAVQNVLCLACAATARLAELGKLDLCYSSVMAQYAVAQTKEGRMVGHTLNCQDVSSEYCRQRKNVVLEQLDRHDTVEETWNEILVEDRNAGPAQIAAVRIDFAAWLKTLKPRTRKIAQFLSKGNRTKETAKKFDMSECRVSQLRQELKAAWELFIDENAAVCAQ